MDITEIRAKLPEEAHKAFDEAIKGAKFVDLKDGGYVSQEKYTDLEIKLSETNKAFKKLTDESGAAGQTIEQLTAQIAAIKTEHDNKINEITAQTAADKKATAVKMKLIQAGAHDADLTISALKDVMDKIELKSNGDVVGISDHIKELQTQRPFLFKSEEPKGTHVPGNPASNDPVKNFDYTKVGLKND